MTLHVALIAFSRCVRQGWQGGWLPFLFVVVSPPSAIQMCRYKVRDFLRRIGRVKTMAQRKTSAAEILDVYSDHHAWLTLLLLLLAVPLTLMATCSPLASSIRFATLELQPKQRAEGARKPKTHNNERWATSHAASGHLVCTSILLAAHSSSEIYSIGFISSSGRCSFTQITRNGNKAVSNKRLQSPLVGHLLSNATSCPLVLWIPEPSAVVLATRQSLVSLTKRMKSSLAKLISRL